VVVERKLPEPPVALAQFWPIMYTFPGMFDIVFTTIPLGFENVLDPAVMPVMEEPKLIIALLVAMFVQYVCMVKDVPTLDSPVVEYVSLIPPISPLMIRNASVMVMMADPNVKPAFTVLGLVMPIIKIPVV
jgi:hypothetical protein